MPLLAGDGPFRVVASLAIDGIDRVASESAVVEWHWYYHGAAVPLWAILALALVGLRENRNFRAWLILIPLAVVLILWRTPMLLFGAGERTSQYVGAIVVAAAMSWALLWLIAPKLVHRSRAVTIFVMGVFLIVFGGLAIYVQGVELMPCLTIYGIAMLGAVLGMAIAARPNRRPFRPTRFAVWMFLGWLVITWMAIFGMFAFSLAGRCAELPASILIGQMIAVSVMASELSLAGYAVQFPFLILAFNHPFYRDRFDAIFHIPKDVTTTAVVSEKDVVETNEDSGGSKPCDG
ncbi:MAG: hypothetical protein ABFC54_06405 [Thermoguttaceae bacterium]